MRAASAAQGARCQRARSLGINAGKFYLGTQTMSGRPPMTKKLPVRLFQPIFGLFMALFMSFLMWGQSQR
jgi:hypothetical protein